VHSRSRCPPPPPLNRLRRSPLAPWSPPLARRLFRSSRLTRRRMSYVQLGRLAVEVLDRPLEVVGELGRGVGRQGLHDLAEDVHAILARKGLARVADAEGYEGRYRALHHRDPVLQLTAADLQLLATFLVLLNRLPQKLPVLRLVRWVNYFYIRICILVFFDGLSKPLSDVSFLLSHLDYYRLIRCDPLFITALRALKYMKRN
jgi:hypothetical protein